MNALNSLMMMGTTACHRVTGVPQTMRTPATSWSEKLRRGRQLTPSCAEISHFGKTNVAATMTNTTFDAQVTRLDSVTQETVVWTRAAESRWLKVEVVFFLDPIFFS